MTTYVGFTMFWSMFARKFGFGQIWPQKLVLVDFGQKNGSGRFWREKLVFVDFGRKNWSLTEKTSFDQFWPTKEVLVDFDWEKRVAVNFDHKNGFC